MIATDDPYADEREAARDARDAQDHGPDDDRPSRQELRDDERKHDKWFAGWASEGADDELPRWVHGRGFTDMPRDDDEVF